MTCSGTRWDDLNLHEAGQVFASLQLLSRNVMIRTMTVYDCPYRDKGKCVPPTEAGQNALVVFNGEVSLLSGGFLARLMSNVGDFGGRAFIDAAAFPEPADPDVVESILQSLSNAVRISDFLERQPEKTRGGDYLYFSCAPCGHIVKLPLP